ncbi:hypothetical protein ACFQ2B_40590 [Streptomyces stramineus]|uniref:Uncharacterized protein n=1 Tax=Streptomyces stramineus TaxID=173861 RepID=A0ABP3JU13_9ACTN
MTYKVVVGEDARRGMAGLEPAQRRAVNDAVRGELAMRPLSVGSEYEGHGSGALRLLVLEAARVSIGYRVYSDRVEVEIVWLLGHP